jgi:hypothetical protein
MFSRVSLRAVAAATAIIAIPSLAFAAVYYHRIFDPKKGGSVCYLRTYTEAFLKKHPGVNLTAVTLERRSNVSDATPNSKKKFGITFNATTKTESYQALAECTPQGSIVSCNVEADGGTFTIMKAGKSVVIKTRRIQIEGYFKELEIVAKRGGAARSFTLYGGGKKTCEALTD